MMAAFKLLIHEGILHTIGRFIPKECKPAHRRVLDEDTDIYENVHNDFIHGVKNSEFIGSYTREMVEQ